MVSPVLNENMMVEALNPSEPEKIGDNADRLRSGAMMLIVDAYDRKATRDHFLAAVASALGLTDMLGRFEMMAAVKEFDEANGRVTKADIEVTIAGVTSKIALHTDQCAKMAKLVQQCPLNEDKVH